MRIYRVRPGGPLRGEVTVPGDKSVGHRALIFAALSRGECEIRGLSGGRDNAATAAAFRRMGVDVELAGTSARVRGVGLGGLRMAPDGVVDCGNSGTTMRLLAGLLSAQRFGTRLVGDASLGARPMGRIVGPLRARGAHVAGVARPGDGREGETYPPLSIAPLLEDERLGGLEYESPVASAQVKSALLLSGLYADGVTAIREPVLSRDHTERMMLSLGVPLETFGPMVVLDPTGWERGWGGFAWSVPGDLSSAAFLIAAAATVPGSAITITGVGVNPTRTGVLDACRAMGLRVAHTPKGEAAGGEPIADLEVAFGPGRGALVGGELLVRMIDEVPALAALAASAQGTTRVRDAAELRVKESDRLAAMANVLGEFGVACRELEDGLDVDGGARRGARVDSRGDHRVAMAATVLALAAEGDSEIRDVDCVETSFPGFAATLRALGADVSEVRA